MLYNVDLDYAYQKTVHGAASWTLTGLACSTVYTFQVQAIDQAGARSIATKLGVTGACSPACVSGPLVPAEGVLFGGYVHPTATWTQSGVTLPRDAAWSHLCDRCTRDRLRRRRARPHPPLGHHQRPPPAAHSLGRRPFPGWAAITDGSQDAYLRSLAAALRSVGAPVFFRPFQEFNGSWFANYSRRPHRVRRRLAAYVDSLPSRRRNQRRVGLEPQRCRPTRRTRTPLDSVLPRRSLRRLGRRRRIQPRRHHRPHPPEPFHGHLQRLPHQKADHDRRDRRAGTQQNELWITSLRRTLKHLPNIAAVVWFDQDNAARGWDWRITTTPAALTAYKTWAKDPYYTAR